MREERPGKGESTSNRRSCALSEIHEKPTQEWNPCDDATWYSIYHETAVHGRCIWHHDVLDDRDERDHGGLGESGGGGVPSGPDD